MAPQAVMSLGRRRAEIAKTRLSSVSISYPLKSLEGTTSDIASLKATGIRTTATLLEAAKTPKGRKLLSAKTGIDPKRLLQWANMADRMRVKGLGKEYAELLRVVGVDTVKELKYRNPGKHNGNGKRVTRHLSQASMNEDVQRQ